MNYFEYVCFLNANAWIGIIKFGGHHALKFGITYSNGGHVEFNYTHTSLIYDSLCVSFTVRGEEDDGGGGWVKAFVQTHKNRDKTDTMHFINEVTNRPTGAGKNRIFSNLNLSLYGLNYRYIRDCLYSSVYKSDWRLIKW